MSIKDNKPITVSGLIAEFIRSHKYMLVLYICFLLIMPIKDIGIPHLFGKLIQSIEDKSSLLRPLAYLFIATLLLQCGYSLIDFMEIELSPRFQAFVRHKIMKHIFDENNENISDVESGMILARLMRLPSSLYTLLNQWKYIFIPNGILSIAAVLYFASYNLMLGIVLALLIVFAWFMVYYSVIACFKYSYQSEKTVAKLYEQTDDVLNNMTTVIGHNQSTDEIDSLQDLEKNYRMSVKNTMLCSMKLRYTVVPLNVGYFILFSCMCYSQVKKRKMKAAAFVALTIIMFKIFNSIWDISGVMNDTVTRWGLIRQTMQVFKTLPQHKLPPTEPSKFILSNGFFLDNVTFEYFNGRTTTRIFDRFTLNLVSKQTVVIKGGIGSGKTTLMKLLLKQLTPQSGTIYYQGVSYKKLRTDDIRRLIGFIPQSPFLFNRTIFENITYGLEGIDRDSVWKLLTSLGLEPMFKRFPKKLDTNVGKHGSELSGGQRQIITIVRMILKNSPVILMDEPTASIDTDTKKIVYDLVSKIMKERTVIMVTHDDFLLQFADRVIELQKGKVVKDQMMN
jgi:ABC-type multidrug transport system fused ATPase/permease subunit